jgi:hypothetical protein
MDTVRITTVKNGYIVEPDCDNDRRFGGLGSFYVFNSLEEVNEFLVMQLKLTTCACRW